MTFAAILLLSLSLSLSVSLGAMLASYQSVVLSGRDLLHHHHLALAAAQGVFHTHSVFKQTTLFILFLIFLFLLGDFTQRYRPLV